jgi:hypothetical protein
MNDEIEGSEKSYCRECKRMTETVLIERRPGGILGMFIRSWSPICKVCGKAKPASRIKMEKREKSPF